MSLSATRQPLTPIAAPSPGAAGPVSHVAGDDDMRRLPFVVLTRIGILSDTHMPAELGVLWDEVRRAFDGVDLILHSGDIVHPMVLDQLEVWAPVVAAIGNNDVYVRDPRVAATQWLD